MTTGSIGAMARPQNVLLHIMKAELGGTDLAFRHSDKERAEEHHKGPTKGPAKSVVTPYSVTDEVYESDQDGGVESANDN